MFIASKVAPVGQNMNNPGFQPGEKGTQKNPAAVECSSKNKSSFGRKGNKMKIDMSKLEVGEYHYNGFTYKLDECNSWSIKKENQVEPTSLFKYYANNNNGRNAISNGYFFLSHPYHFNDSLDCFFDIIDYSMLTKDILRSLFNSLQKEVSEEELDKCFAERITEIKNYYWSKQTRHFGILSLCETPLNTLMWSHYSNEDGFMIEIDKSKFMFDLKNLGGEKNNLWLTNRAFAPVNYVPNLEPIPIFKENKWNNPTIPFMYMANVKHEDWKYENEWRLICFISKENNFNIPNSLNSHLKDEGGNIERKLYYSKEIINSIVLGKNFFNGSNTGNIKVLDSNQKMEITLKNNKQLSFIKMLFNDFKDKLYQCVTDTEGEIKRTILKIEIERISNTIYEVKYSDFNLPSWAENEN